VRIKPGSTCLRQRNSSLAAIKQRGSAMMKASFVAMGLLLLPFALQAQTPEQIAIAEQVYQGKLPCELGAYVVVKADAKVPGYFEVQFKKQKYRMLPVVTTTGAIRLEDAKAGAVWLQLSNKSMLMDQKQGRRLTDECMSSDQAVVAKMLTINPMPSLLDKPVVVAEKEILK
jgi:hypothetical protein